MQTFPSLQRSIFSKTYLIYLLLIFLFVYDNISMIYNVLPQLLGLYFIIFIKFQDDFKYSYSFFAFILLTIFYESSRSLPLLSILFFFIFVYTVVIPIIDQYVGCMKCKNYIYIIFIYIGYYVFSLFLTLIFDITIFEISLVWLFYYIILDILLLVLV